MMGYKVVQTSMMVDKVNVTPAWEIVEKRPEFQEEINVKTTFDEESARKMSRHLNFGGGFDGWTPSFFNLKYDAV